MPVRDVCVGICASSRLHPLIRHVEILQPNVKPHSILSAPLFLHRPSFPHPLLWCVPLQARNPCTPGCFFTRAARPDGMAEQWGSSVVNPAAGRGERRGGSRRDDAGAALLPGASSSAESRRVFQAKAAQANRMLSKLERDLTLLGTSNDSASVRTRVYVRNILLVLFTHCAGKQS